MCESPAAMKASCVAAEGMVSWPSVPSPHATPHDAVRALVPYIGRHLASGGRLHAITRHMLGLFAGRPGARRWRQILSTEGTGADAGLATLDAALASVPETSADAA